MIGLLSLPNELIAQIHIFAPVRSQLQLSAVNGRLRSIWLRDADYIIAQRVQLTAPNNTGAVALTLLDSCCPSASFAAPTLAQHQTYVVLPRKDRPDHDKVSSEEVVPMPDSHALLPRTEANRSLSLSRASPISILGPQSTFRGVLAQYSCRHRYLHWILA